MKLCFTEQGAGGVRGFAAPALLDAGCRHLFTTSADDFRLSGRRPQESEAFAGLARGFGTDVRALRYARQVHGADILVHRRGAQAAETPPAADGHVSDASGLVLVTFHADCAPVYLYDPAHRAAGMLHSGWRGTAQNIAARGVAAMVREFGSRPGDLFAAVGPCICMDCFETDADVPAAMRAAYGADADAFIRREGEKYRVDIPGLIAHALRACGVPDGRITLSCLCTRCLPDLFWSHRRQGDRRGVMAAAIGL